MSPKIRFELGSDSYSDIPEIPIAYWVNDNFRKSFALGKILGHVAEPRAGLATGNNDLFERFWFEVAWNNIKFDAQSTEDTKNAKEKWYPCNSGGTFRKWSFNNELVVNWQNDGYEIRHFVNGKGKLAARPQNTQFYFKKGLTWNKLSSNRFAAKFKEEGFIFDDTSRSIFVDESILRYLLALLCSNVALYYLKVFNPTMSFTNGDISRIPFILDNEKKANIEDIVDSCLLLSMDDWNDSEYSWDFTRHPLTEEHTMGKLISYKYMEWEEKCQHRFDKLKENEEEINRIFIDIYGMQDELKPDVQDKDVTVRLADKERDIRSLISYLVGVAMGRYSLDVPGLAYAGGKWDESKYVSYQPDDDGIIPIYNGIGMEDGLTTVLIKLIKQIYGEDTYKQNIDFIAEALGKNNNESSEESLNRYLNDGFYADHLKVYQKRPIYWLFTSGKKAGFKCLIYMHRYNEDTLARINAKYFLPESTRKKNELEELNGKIAHAEGRDKVRLEKERQNLAAAYNEAIEYGQILDHMANRYISIDLDDGVKENYAKFQGVEIVTDGGSKVKKDLLSPLK